MKVIRTSATSEVHRTLQNRISSGARYLHEGRAYFVLAEYAVSSWRYFLLVDADAVEDLGESEVVA